MGELRKDYVLNRYVIIATERAKRPDQFKSKPLDKNVKICYFCPGNEHTTPPEIGRFGNDKWYIRWFENKFPAVREEGQRGIRTDNTYYTFSSSFGKHEVIVETPNHEEELSDLSVEHIRDLLLVYNNRINELEHENGIKYVSVFKNHKPEAGTSIIHSHSQVIATNLIPPVVLEKSIESKRHGRCAYCDVIQSEKNSYRRCFENDTFVSFTPYASRSPFEIVIFPKVHKRRLDNLNDHEFLDLASMLKKILLKLKTLDAPYNMYIHYSPKDLDLHMHIEIVPRLTTWAGFEMSTGIIINPVPPEDAAKFYRE